MEFVDLNYSPTDEDLIALFLIEPAPSVDMLGAAAKVAAESSTGTWTELTTMSDRIRKISAKVFRVEGNKVLIAYPHVLFEPGSMSQIWSAIAGNLFGMKAVSSVRLEDVFWPSPLVKSFKGPLYGLYGVRSILNVKDRPILATVPKPKVGMTAEEHADVAYQVWVGGVDLVKDDENLTSLSFCKFEDRLKELMRRRDEAEKETGEKKAVLANVTAPFHEMNRRIRLVHDYGNEFVMIDILTAGWSAVQSAREIAEEYGLAIHAHRAFHAAFGRIRNHGVSMKVVAESARLVGVDNIHVGTVVGKLVSPKDEVISLVHLMRDRSMKEDLSRGILEKNWLDIRPVTPVSSGGLHPGIIADVLDIVGMDVIIQVGGGVLGHPEGPLSGARAFRQSIEAYLSGIDVGSYAEAHHELKVALEKWGRAHPM